MSLAQYRRVVTGLGEDGSEPAVTAIVTLPALPVGKGRNV